MTDEEINIEIAKATGDIIINGEWTTEEIVQCGAIREIKRYCNDLNAMHEAENALDLAARRKFRNILSRHTIPKLAAIHATAAQRAEAFLRTLNLWKE